MSKGQPYLPNLEPILAAGINPKTGLPVKFSQSVNLKEDIKKQLRLVDEQDAVNRYVWKNLPMNLTSQEVERMLYYKGQLCFYHDKDLDQYYFMPYALDGTIDFYGRFNTIHPIPMTSGTDDTNGKAQAQYLAGKKLRCIYGTDGNETVDPENSCVLLHDYTKQLSQIILPRVTVNDSLLDVMAECIPYLRTCLISGSGIKGIRVNDADQAQNVHDASKSTKHAALTGEPWIPVTGEIEMQELTDGTVLKAEEFMQSMQSLDNFRLSTMGLQNGGLFSKKAHELQTEADMNGGPVELVMQDGLEIRKHFCELANEIWGLNIEVDENETLKKKETAGDEPLTEETEGDSKDE